MTPAAEIRVFAGGIIVALLLMFAMVASSFGDARHWEQRYFNEHAVLQRVVERCQAAPDGSAQCAPGTLLPPTTTTSAP